MDDPVTPGTIARLTTLALLALALAGCGPAEPEKKSADASGSPAGAASQADAPAAAKGATHPQGPGRLVVKSNRAGAAVEATRTPGPQEAARAPFKGVTGEALTGLPPGPYTVSVQAAGWPELRGATTITPGGTAVLELNFPAGSLKLESVPAGAMVKHGSEVLGKTPLVIPQLPVGECKLSLEYPNWPALVIRPVIVANTESAESVRLPHGKLTVESSPAGATVLLAKRKVGQTPLVLDPTPAGALQVSLQSKDFPPLEVTVTLADRGEATLRRELGRAFPPLDPPSLLRAVWVPDNKDKLTDSFDATGRFAPQNGIVKNLDRKKVSLNWLNKKYRHTGTVKAYDAKTNVLEFNEDKSDLARFRILARIGPGSISDPLLNPAALKGATLSVYGTLTGAEEPRWPAKAITLELSAAELLHDAP